MKNRIPRKKKKAIKNTQAWQQGVFYRESDKDLINWAQEQGLSFSDTKEVITTGLTNAVKPFNYPQ